MIQKQIEELRAVCASKTMAAEYIKRHLYQGYRPCKEAVTREHIADADCYVCTFEDGSRLIDDEPFLILIENKQEAKSMLFRNDECKRFYELEKSQQQFIADCFINGEMDRLEFRALAIGSVDYDGFSGNWIPLDGKSKTLHRNGIYRTASHGPIKVKWDRIDSKWGYVAIEDCGSICLMSQVDDGLPILIKDGYNGLRWHANGDSMVATQVFSVDTFEIPDGLKWEESLTMRPRDA